MSTIAHQPAGAPDELDALLAHLEQGLAPADVLERAHLLFLDTVGCAIAGLRAPAVKDFAGIAARLDARAVAIPLVQGPGAEHPPVSTKPDSTGAAGASRLYLSAPAASSALAMAACWDEACEGLAFAHGRPGVPVVAAVLAVGVTLDCSVGEALAAVITGYEIGGRMGARLRIKPGMHVDAGWPALGVAAAVAKLLGGGAAQQRDAIEIAAAQLPVGLYLPVAQGADGRNTYLGHAAALGVQAAMAVTAGVRAPRGAVDAHAQIALGQPPGSTQALEPAERWLLREGYLKRWPAVKHVHYGIAAARALREALAGAAIARIRLRVYPEALTYCGNRSPATPIQAQFSLSFGLAVALHMGELGPEAYREPAFHDAEVRRLEGLVELVADPALGDGGRRAVVLEVHDASGRRLEHRVDEVEGDPARPLGRDAVREKFVRMVAPTLGPHGAAALADEWLAIRPSMRLATWWARV